MIKYIEHYSENDVELNHLLNIDADKMMDYQSLVDALDKASFHTRFWEDIVNIDGCLIHEACKKITENNEYIDEVMAMDVLKSYENLQWIHILDDRVDVDMYIRDIMKYLIKLTP
jgi:hypothetical protein